MKAKLRDALRWAVPRFLVGTLGVWCGFGPFVVIKASESAGWGITALLSLLLLVCYAVIFVLCLRAKWDALKELVAETRLALGFMIVGLLLNEITGIFVTIKHKLVFLYAFIGFLIAEIIKAKYSSSILNRLKPTKTDTRADSVAGTELFEEHSSEIAAAPGETGATENRAGSTGQAESPVSVDNYTSAQRHSASAEACGEEIFFDKHFLREEFNHYRSRLSASETQLREVGRRSQDTDERNGCLEAEVANLKHQFSDMQSKNREIANSLRSFPEMAFEKVWFKDQLQQLESRIVRLESQLVYGAMQVQELDDARERLRESERALRELAEENRRISGVVSAWQERLTAREDSETRVDLLWREIQEILTKYPACVEGKAVAQEKLADAAHSVPCARDDIENAVGQLPSHHAQQGRANISYLGAGDSPEGVHFQTHAKSKRVVWFPVKQHSRFGAVAAAIFLIITAVAIGVRETKFPEPIAPPHAPDRKAQEDKVKTVSKPAINPAPRLRGIFETVRPTQVYTGPSENSALIADIGPGIKLNVVNSVYGWLEIRSKRGRPPGFVRQEATVRIALN